MIPYYEVPDLPVLGARFHPFGFLVAVGVLVGHWILSSRAKSLGLGPPARVDLFVVVVFASGFLVGHMFDAVFYHPESLRQDWRELFMIHHGLSSFGGVLGAVLGGRLYIRAYKLDPWVWTDLCTYSFPFGWFFGRMGCAAVHDHIGRPSESLLAVRFPGGPRFDLGLLEFLLTPLLIALVVWVSRRTARPGMISGALALGYSLLRFPLDFLRATDLGLDSDRRYGGLTPAQYACVATALLGAAIIYRARRDPPLRDPA
ncbi:MAG: prolipoprotein diacylglyceryl transferase [Polyangiales bacterium]